MISPSPCRRTFRPASIDFTLDNHGGEPHEIRFIRLAAGHTFDDFVTWQKSGTAIPEWLISAAGIGAVAPGLHQEYLMSLQPGAYVALCSYPSDNGAPHTDKGMFAALTVDAGAPTATPPAEADVTITLTDHHFQLTAPFDGPHPLIHLRNGGTEPHQAQIIKLPDEPACRIHRARLVRARRKRPAARHAGRRFDRGAGRR